MKTGMQPSGCRYGGPKRIGWLHAAPVGRVLVGRDSKGHLRS